MRSNRILQGRIYTRSTTQYYRSRTWCSPKKKKRSLTLPCRSPLQIFVTLPNCPSFQTYVIRDFTGTEYLAKPFDFLWPTLFTCVQNFTSFFMLETAQRSLNNCAAAHARSLEGTLVENRTLVLRLRRECLNHYTIENQNKSVTFPTTRLKPNAACD